MKTSVNIIRNADFSQGAVRPNRWTWQATSTTARWRRDGTGLPEGKGMTIETGRARGTAGWYQTVKCKPGEFYRIEATVTCDLTATGQGSTDDAAGLVLAVEPVAEDQPTGARRVTPGLHRTTEPMAVRTYYRVPPQVHRLRVSVAVVLARGTAQIHHVRFIPILEPDETSHVLALPTPPHALSAPRVVRRVCICSATATTRPITHRLAQYFGPSNISTVGHDSFDSMGKSPTDAALDSTKPHDALLLPDATPPAGIRTMTSLFNLAANRLVVISLPAFARLSRKRLSLRRVEQDDDPIHAKVTYANHATHGFALQDTFPYAWPGRTVGSFVQNHFRRTTKLKSLCARHGLVTLLTSMADQDLTSDRPICLSKQTPGGGLYVLDIEPAEAAGSTYDEPVPAVHLLLSILGQTQTSLGQYTSPFHTGTAFRKAVSEMALRFDPVGIHGADVPADEATDQLVTLAGNRQPPHFITIGKTAHHPPAVCNTSRMGELPVAEAVRGDRPLILVRSGLVPGDLESVYGAMLWFKQLARPEPHPCPYVKALTAEFELAWTPLLTKWDARQGWRPMTPMNGQAGATRSAGATVNRTHSGTAATPAVIIDVISRPINRVRVVLPGDQSFYRRCALWLGRLTASFPVPKTLTFDVAEGAPFTDRDQFAWRFSTHEVKVAIEPERFQSKEHCDVMARGGRVIRIEVPRNDAAFATHSIGRTDQVATLLEQVVGLQYGLIAVNRQATVVRFDRFGPVSPGDALVIHRHDPLLSGGAAPLQGDAARAG